MLASKSSTSPTILVSIYKFEMGEIRKLFRIFSRFVSDDGCLGDVSLD